jgi:hypothetical protein
MPLEARVLLAKIERELKARRLAGHPDLTLALQQKLDALRVAVQAITPAGLVEQRRARSTGTLVGLYRSVEAGMESDPELPWSVVCEPHGGIVCTESRAHGRSAMSCPDDWCPVCQGDEPDPSE